MKAAIELVTPDVLLKVQEEIKDCVDVCRPIHGAHRATRDTDQLQITSIERQRESISDVIQFPS
ncbi:hypothetical protein J6590_085270 [Homalodisca vitripennis]|nr:hypothetical protein J6590_085270 [Homalodisca vitripennis]